MKKNVPSAKDYFAETRKFPDKSFKMSLPPSYVQWRHVSDRTLPISDKTAPMQQFAGFTWSDIMLRFDGSYDLRHTLSDYSPLGVGKIDRYLVLIKGEVTIVTFDSKRGVYEESDLVLNEPFFVSKNVPWYQLVYRSEAFLKLIHTDILMVCF